jgi:outer membrane protein
MKKISVFILALLSGFGAMAQQASQTPTRWTLEECLDYARQHNLQVKQSELGLLSSKIELDRSKADLYPTLNAGGSYSYSVGRSIDPVTNGVVDEPLGQQSTFINTGVTLFNGFAKQNTIKQNKTAFKANEFELAATKNNISLQIVTAYTNILFNRELLANAEARLRATRLQMERTQKQVEVGALAQASLFEIEAQGASDELAVTNASNSLELAKLNLKQLLQLPASQSVEIVDPELELEEVKEYPVSAEEVYDVAEDTQPAINAADTRVISSQYGLRAAKGYLLPSISAQAGINTAYASLSRPLPIPGTEREEVVPVGFYLDENNAQQPVYIVDDVSDYEELDYFGQLDYNLRRYAQVSLNIPIFNGFQTRSAVSRARITQDRAQLEAQITRQQLRQTIEQAAQDVKAAALTYRSTENQVRSLREAFRSAEQRFNLGAANAVDYNIAKTNLDVAESNFIRAKYDYIFKTKILDFYLNKPLSFN